MTDEPASPPGSADDDVTQDPPMRPRKLALLLSLVAAALVTVAVVLAVLLARPPADVRRIVAQPALKPAVPAKMATGAANAPETGSVEASGSIATTAAPAPKLPVVAVVRRPRPAGDPDREAVTVLMYHEVKPNPDNDNAISPEMFERHMSWLAENGYHALSLEQFMGLVDAGRRVPSKPVLITFDDGYMNLCFHAVPILEKYRFKATFFVVKDWSLDMKHQTWMHPKQLQDLVKRGFDVQSHTASHAWLEARAGEDYAAVKKRLWGETFGAKRWLESVTHKPVYAIAYPSGIHDSLTTRLVGEAGYLLGFTTDPGRDRFDAQSDYELHRYQAGAGGRSFGSFTSILRRSPRATRRH